MGTFLELFLIISCAIVPYGIYECYKLFVDFLELSDDEDYNGS